MSKRLTIDEKLIKYDLGECPDEHNHTKSPNDYLGWHDWAEKKSKLYRQVRCNMCGRLSIWIKKD